MTKFGRRMLAVLVVVFILLAAWVPTYIEVARAYTDEWAECTYCGLYYWDVIFCDTCGGCNEDGIDTCYEEHHHECCGNCKEDVPEYCAICGDCSDCASDMCSYCWRCSDCLDYCDNCGTCIECIEGFTGEGRFCNDCGDCYMCISNDGRTFCFSCDHCSECKFICGECEEICIECPTVACSQCHTCSNCKGGDDLFCTDCEKCFDCYGGIQCRDCEECLECTNMCEQCYDICDYCTENYCSSCNSCVDCTGDEYCHNCGDCSSCASDICPNCDVCTDCSLFDICESCEEYCRNCTRLCVNCLTCAECTTVCENSCRCDDCGIMCQNCGTCEECSIICDNCRETCNGCENLCGCCNYCSECVRICLECDNCENTVEYQCDNCDRCSDCEDVCPIRLDHCTGCGVENFCKECEACDQCADHCQGCGKYCSECLTVCRECNHCEKCHEGECEGYHIHEFTQPYEYDETHHWKICDHCDFTYDKMKHIYKPWEVGESGKERKDCHYCDHYLERDLPPEVEVHTVTFDSKGGSDVKPQQIKNGEKLRYVSSRKTGYYFQGWSTTDGGSELWNFEDPVTSEMTLYAIWSEQSTPTTKYVLSVINGTGNKIAEENEEVEIKANEIIGKEFVNWSGIEGLTFIEGDESTADVKFKMPAKNVKAVANFKNIEGETPETIYTVYVNNGTATPTSGKAGTEITVTADTLEDKNFKVWHGAAGLTITEGDETSSTFKFLMPNRTVMLGATYESEAGEEFYSINVVNGTATPNLAAKGSEITLKADTIPGKVFVKWNGLDYANITQGSHSTPNLKFKMLGFNLDLEAVFKNKTVPEKEFNINVIRGKSDKLKAKPGETVNLTADSTYGIFYQWGSDLDIHISNGYFPNASFIMPEKDITIYGYYTSLIKPPIIPPESEGEDKPGIPKPAPDYSKPVQSAFKPAQSAKPSESETVYDITVKIGSKVILAKVNGVEKTINMDVEAFIENGRVMLPIRFVAESLGFTVEWDHDNWTAVLKDEGTIVRLPIDSNKIIVNGVEYESDVKHVLKNSRTFISIGNVARSLGLKEGTDIIWNPNTMEATIKRKVKN